ncbi:MAG: HTH-type transcriptional activator IlvY, partial [Geopsychrobacter sp.]|nr:HTH-type transcriptional activator IlvY [Geopsychrobacter sp.]
MQTRELEIFLTLADLLHFGRASQICNLSASALTRTIQRLEEQVGQPLFIRDKRTVSLTATGQKFRLFARQTLQDWQRFQATLKSEQSIAGTLSIYASITAVYSLLPDLLQSYRSAYPKVQLELRTGTADQAVAQVQTGEIDLAVAALPDHNRSQIEFLPITTTPLVFIAPLSTEDPNALYMENSADLSKIPLVLPQAGLARRRLEKWLKKKRILLNIGSEVSGNEAIIPMV